MPSKKKSKKPLGEANTFEILLATAVLSPDLESLIKAVCERLAIPDLKSKRGLKHCHESFATISATLDTLFQQCREHRLARVSADHLSAATIVIYEQMGEDSLLRKRIVNEAHFFQKAMALLHSESEDARVIAMSTLSSASHWKDSAILQDLSNFIPTILDAAEVHSTQLNYLEKAVCVLAHTSTAVFVDDAPDPKLTTLVSLPRILRFMLGVVRLPNSTRLSYDHFTIFCYHTIPKNPDIFLSVPDSIDFLVASTRSKDLISREVAQHALVSLFSMQEDRAAPSDFGSSQSLGPPPPHVRQALQRYYGDVNSDNTALIKTMQRTEELSDLMDDFEDACSSHFDLGHALGELILRSEDLVRSEVCGPEGDQIIRMLRLCEAAVRGGGHNLKNVLIADVLRWELLFSTGSAEASKFARDAVQWYPSEAFFYYAMTVCHPSEVAAVLYGEKGLQCASMSESLRQELLFNTISSSYHIITKMLQGRPEEIRLKEVNHLIWKAASFAATFVRDAPPDHPYAPSINAVAILLDILMHGHLFTEDFIRTGREKYDLVSDIARYTGFGIWEPSNECLAVDRILARMSPAWRRWGPIICRHPSRGYMPVDPNNDSDPDADLIAWFKKLDFAPPKWADLEMRGIDPGTRRVGQAQMHCCSSCNKPSAVLKRCAGCQMARYCNDTCQKKDWKAHRDICRASRVDLD
ncbi:hypothetical protein FB45DRAFT_1054571 [Roridomyces roridus]|uniref:MYND-type domain-containing protein n=1 Tax=Roridomyces roridus TaxID=1738132 RepID=A0AAD7C3D2_9AGAR|nr:hypothetical protein FB45DRAFT_1054571 [Roridomyces roridus]